MKYARRYDPAVLPWLDSAYNLARWLMRDDTSAEDAVQEAVLRALLQFDPDRVTEARTWFLGLVRSVCFTHLRGRTDWKDVAGHSPFTYAESRHARPPASEASLLGLQQYQERRNVNAALRSLTPPLREVLVLKDIEGLSDAQIAQVTAATSATVTSRLNRARARMLVTLTYTGSGGHDA